MKIFNRVFILIIMFIPIPLNAEDTYVAPFLAIHPSVRQAALGGTQVGEEGNLASLFNNPAAFGSLGAAEGMFSHISTFLNEDHEFIGIGYPYKKQAIAAVFQYTNSPRIEKTEVGGNGEPVGLGSIHPYAVVGRISWCAQINTFGSLGFTIKKWKENIDESSYTGSAIDMGLISREFHGKIKYGFSILNVGSSHKDSKPPQVLNLGSRYHFFLHSKPFIQFLGNYSYSSHDRSLNLGIESKNMGNLELRGGYQIPMTDTLEQYKQWTLGAGLRYRAWLFDYAWKTSNDFSDQHLISVHLQLGLSADEKIRLSQQMDREISNRITQKAKLHYEQALDYMEIKDWDGAIEELNISFAWDPHNSSAKETLSKAIYNKNQSTIDSLTKKGKYAQSQESWADATLYFQEASRMDPQNQKLASLVRFSKEKLTNSNITQSIKNTGEQEIFNKGVSYYIDGDFQRALIEWKKLDKRGVAFPKLQEYLAKAKSNVLEGQLQSQNKTKEDDRYVEKLLRNAYTNYTMGNSAEAEILWKKVLVLDLHNEEAQWALIHLHEQRKMDINSYKNNVDDRVNKFNSEALKAYSSGDLNQAIDLWKKARKIDPRDLRIQKNIERVEAELLLKESLP